MSSNVDVEVWFFLSQVCMLWLSTPTWMTSLESHHLLIHTYWYLTALLSVFRKLFFCHRLIGSCTFQGSNTELHIHLRPRKVWNFGFPLEMRSPFLNLKYLCMSRLLSWTINKASTGSSTCFWSALAFLAGLCGRQSPGSRQANRQWYYK